MRRDRFYPGFHDTYTLTYAILRLNSGDDNSEAEASSAPSASVARRQAGSVQGSVVAESARSRSTSVRVTRTPTPGTFAAPTRSTPSTRQPSSSGVCSVTTAGPPPARKVRLPHPSGEEEEESDLTSEDESPLLLVTSSKARNSRLPTVHEHTAMSSEDEEGQAPPVSRSIVPAKSRLRSLSAVSSLTSITLPRTPVRRTFSEDEDAMAVSSLPP